MTTYKLISNLLHKENTIQLAGFLSRLYFSETYYKDFIMAL